MSTSDPYPRHAYDCGHCKYAWCCGPLCACVPCIEPAPKRRAAFISRVQRNWSRAKTIPGKCRWALAATVAKHRWARAEGRTIES